MIQRPTDGLFFVFFWGALQEAVSPLFSLGVIFAYAMGGREMCRLEALEG
jgi:hypothetical protein